MLSTSDTGELDCRGQFPLTVPVKPTVGKPLLLSVLKLLPYNPRALPLSFPNQKQGKADPYGSFSLGFDSFVTILQPPCSSPLPGGLQMQVGDFASLGRRPPRPSWLLLMSEGCWLSPPVAICNTWLHTCLSFVPFPICHYYFSDNRKTTGSRGSRQQLLQLIKCLKN